MLTMREYFLTFKIIGFKSSHKSSNSNIMNRIIRIFLLKMSFGSVRSLPGIPLHSFAPVLENDFRSI